MFSSSEIQAVTELMQSVADREILPHFGHVGREHISFKGRGEYVTFADQAAEKALSAGLTQIRPQAFVVGEEGVSTNPDTLRTMRDRQPLWIVDPLDGTRNFAHGRRQFAVMVAYIADGETQAGWILDPLRRLCISAQLGRGVLRNGQPTPLNLKDQLRHQDIHSLATKGIHPTGGLRRLYCVGQEYILMTEGVAVSGFYRHPKPWDHAAGVLIYRETGGYAALLSGAPYTPLALHPFGLLLAPNLSVWQILAAKFADRPFKS